MKDFQIEIYWPFKILWTLGPISWTQELKMKPIWKYNNKNKLSYQTSCFWRGQKFLIGGILKKLNTIYFEKIRQPFIFIKSVKHRSSVWKLLARFLCVSETSSRKHRIACSVCVCFRFVTGRKSLWSFQKIQLGLRTFSHLRARYLSSRTKVAPLYSGTIQWKRYEYCSCVVILIVQKGQKIIFSTYLHKQVLISA